jgi:GNAT superfamily N-acetyltransferase
LERDHGERFIYISRETFIEEFGWVGGFLRWLWYSCINLQDRRQGELRVQAIAVDESMRGKGAGTMLLNAAFDYARKIGYKAIRLEVVDTNPAAKKLYERLGFVTLKTSWFGPITSSAGFTAANYMRREV